jgi:sugar-specific transcriptional regulator TrmB
MELDTSALKEIGLTNAQIKTYIILSGLDPSTSGEIIKKTKLQSSVVYNALNQLIERGLVGFTMKGKIKNFFTTDSSNLINYIEDRKEKVKELLINLPKKPHAENKVEIFSGWRGIYNSFNYILEVLPKNSEYLSYAGDSKDEYPEEALILFREFQKKRKLKNYHVKIIANEYAKKTIGKYRYYTSFGKPQYKFVPGFSPSETIIFEGHILILDLKEEPLAILIKNKNIFESYKNSFEAIWKIAKN